MTLCKAYDLFIFDKMAQGVTTKTIESYRNILHVFLNFMGNSFDTDLLEMKHIKKYSIELQSRKLSKATISTYMRNVKIFLRWIFEEYNLGFDPSKIRVPKSPKKKVHVYSESEIKQIFLSIETSISWITARNRAMVALMLDSGIRQCEVCGLKRNNIDFQRMYMRVYGKGDKERFVPIGNFALSVLRAYMEVCPFKSEYVFVNKDGTQLSCNAVKLFTSRLQKQLPFEFSSHRLRHNFATNYCLDSLRLKQTAGIYDLSIIMGHTSIETTKKYEHIAREIIAVNSYTSHLDMVYDNKQDFSA